MPRPSASLLAPADARRVATIAKVDPRTVGTYLTGKRSTLPATASNIEKALRRIGRADLVRATPATAAA